MGQSGENLIISAYLLHTFCYVCAPLPHHFRPDFSRFSMENGANATPLTHTYTRYNCSSPIGLQMLISPVKIGGHREKLKNIFCPLHNTTERLFWKSIFFSTGGSHPLFIFYSQSGKDRYPRSRPYAKPNPKGTWA